MTTETSTDAPAARYRSTLWHRQHRATTLGLVLVVTLIAFEFMGVATALPTLVSDLHGGRLYAWPIAAFTAASAIGTVLSGRVTDRRGPALPMLVAVLVFTLGLLIGGTATTMAMLLAGRVVQGFGAGAVVVAVYVVIALVYPDRDRPAASALLAAAWVVPSLVGPAVAGVVTQQFGWRWVFLGLVPLMAVGVALLVRVVRKLPAHQLDQAAPERRGTVLAGVGAAVGVTMFTASAQQLSWVSAPIAVAGLVLTGFALRRLLPPGTWRAGRGLPAVVMSRGVIAGTFASVETYIPLLLTAVHGFTPATAGLPLTVSALGWSAGSAWQGRHPDLPRHRLLTVAMFLVAAGLAGTALVTWPGVPGWWELAAWTVGGAGMGLGVSSISVLVMAQSPKAERGFNTSAVMLADMTGTVLLVGIGGVLVNTISSTTAPGPALFVFDLLACGLAILGGMIPARRSAGRLP